MGKRADIPIPGVAGLRRAREALTGRHVGVLVVAEQDVASFGRVSRVVLGLAVGAHDALVTADPEVVRRRDPARVI